MDLSKIRELSGQLNEAAGRAGTGFNGVRIDAPLCLQSADALNYAADEIERLSKVARLGWQIVWSDALFGGFDTPKPDAEAVAKERLAQADAALKSIRPVSDLSGQAQPPIYICPGTRPCPGSGVRRVARDCPNCGQPCIPHPAFDTQAVPR